MTNSERIEREIEATRARLDLTLDQLQKHASLAALADDALGYLQDKGAATWGRKAAHAARSHPLPVATAILGIGWLIREVSSRPVAERVGQRAASHEKRAATHTDTAWAEDNIESRQHDLPPQFTSTHPSKHTSEQLTPAQR